MRHLKRLKKLGLAKDHRDSLLRNLIGSLVINNHLRTTKTRAKALSSRFARMMNLVQRKEKREAIRILANYCQIEAASKKIIDELKDKYGDRKSGFTRITPIGRRKGDNADLVQIELL